MLLYTPPSIMFLNDLLDIWEKVFLITDKKSALFENIYHLFVSLQHVVLLCYKHLFEVRMHAFYGLRHIGY